MSKPILYTSSGSVWAVVPELAAIELGIDIEKEGVNLVNGDNFKPSFLKINSNATLPTLEAGGNAYTNTTSVVLYLIKASSAEVETGGDVISILHEDRNDPNFAFLAARNDGEMQEKTGLITGYLKNRQDSLKKWSTAPEAAPFKSLYDEKLAQNGANLDIYEYRSSPEAKAELFARSNSFMDNLKIFINKTLPTYLPESGFIGGERPGEADFHVGGWLARVASQVGELGEERIKFLEKLLGEPVDLKVVKYLSAWSERESWKAVYGGGF